MYWGLGLQHFVGGHNSTHSSRSITVWPFCADWLGTCRVGEAQKCSLCLLQVLERWCESPRTIEVLMNTYSTMQLPEEAMGLVPLETLQVRFQDPEHPQTQLPGPKGLPLPPGKLQSFPQPCPRETTQRPTYVPAEDDPQVEHPKHQHPPAPL